MYQLLPDWSHVWTSVEAEDQLEGFKFHGPGFYLTDTDTIVVVPLGSRLGPMGEERKLWSARYQESEQFHFHCYNCPHYETLFSQMGLIPVKLDARTL